jgi:signal transduction histidine kinase
VFRQIRSKLLAAFAVPLAILVAVVAAEVSLSLRLTNGPKNPHSGVATEALAFAALGVVGAIIGLVLVIRVSRSVSSSLVDLAQQAEKLATETLPDTVQAILESAATGDDLPAVPEIQVDSVDEVAGVANALETLKVTALELAAGQAALRRNLADAFVNLGRRNQNLVTRQLEYITEIELKEANPTSLEELFRLDHLATRMRRNAESLLILAGSGPARQWSASVPVMDVARAASAEVEDYKRLRLHHFDHALVTGVVTTDLVHILAELIENALSFSPPGSPVDVYGRTLDGGYVIVVVDSGIGMSAEDLEVANRRLEGHGSSGEVPGRYLGHFVAGRLAARNGIAISLQSSHSGGLVARVKVPSAVVEEPAPDLSAAGEVRRATRPAPDNPADSSIQVSLAPAHQNGASYQAGLAREIGPAPDPVLPEGAGLGRAELAGPPASVSPPTVPLATVPFASAPPVTGLPVTGLPGNELGSEYGAEVDSFEYGADTSLSGRFYDRAGEPGPAANDKGSDELQAHEAVAHDKVTSSEASDELDTPSETLVETEALRAAAEGTVTEHSWDPMMPQKARLDHDAEEIQAQQTQAEDIEAQEVQPAGVQPAEVQPEGLRDNPEANLQRPSWVSWDTSFETVLEPQPEGPAPSVVSGASRVGPPSSPAFSPSRAEELVAASAVASSSQAWSNSLTSTLPPAAASPNAHPRATPAVGPAARARSTADALRKLTRRVPGASLSDEDDSLRRPTPTSTTNNPLGLSGALSQYLSATANEGRPQKEHYA